MYKILVVEDDDGIKGSLELFLAAENFNVTTASNGMEAINILDKFIPDLIVSDIMMPYVDGVELFERVKEMFPDNFISFIFLSSKSDLSSIRRGLNMGADDYITKPFDLRDLITSVNNCRAKKIKYEERIKEIKSSISKYIPHELRTPFVSIIGYANFLKSDFDSLSRDEIFSCLESISKSGLRLYDRIEKFLLLINLEAEINQRHQNHVHSEELVSIDKINALSITEGIAELNNRKEDISVSLEDDLVEISEEELRFIVTELTDNAFKFSEPGTGVLLTGKKTDGLYTLTVQDRGRGMTRGEIARISSYTQFKRNHYQQSGIGLGLYIINKILELNGGSIKISSTPDKSTSIDINLKSFSNKRS